MYKHFGSTEIIICEQVHQEIFQFIEYNGAITMSNVRIIETNAENIGEHGFCGYQSKKNEGYCLKVEWLKQRFQEGMRFLILYSEDDGDVGFIEYTPGEYCWKPVEAPRYMVIHCIAIMKKKFTGQGYGTLLLERCINDARDENMHGVVAFTSKGTWMPKNDLFLKNGFKPVDTAPPRYELLVKKFDDAPDPRFTGDWDHRQKTYGEGLTIITSPQCPYVEKAVREISEAAKELGIPMKIEELRSCKEARISPSPFGTFGMMYNGELIADHPISKRRFQNIMKTFTQ